MFLSEGWQKQPFQHGDAGTHVPLLSGRDVLRLVFHMVRCLAKREEATFETNLLS
jgi:hypothetical protein